MLSIPERAMTVCPSAVDDSAQSAAGVFHAGDSQFERDQAKRCHGALFPEKIASGVKKACQGRPVTDQDLAQLAQRVEETIRQTGASQVDANEIGLAILEPLRELDEVAFLRFASVYQAFESLEDFESAIDALRDSGSTAPGDE